MGASQSNPTAGTTIVLEQTPGTSGQVILSGNSATRVLEVVGNTTTAIIGNVTIEHGKATDDPTGTIRGAGAAAGGGLLNMGGNVMLSQVNFTSNSAAAGAGSDADGGGIYTNGGTLSLNTVALTNNQAHAGAGTTASNGGNAFGGAISEANTIITVTNVPFALGQTPQPLQPNFNPSGITTPLLTVTNNTAVGGRGADGIAAATTGTGGGAGVGGGLQMSGGSVNLAVAYFNDNTAQGGDGGNGAATAAGNGGAGGSAFGGAVEVTSAIAGQNAIFKVQKSTFANNSAQGGNGGLGGNATAAGAAGGNGGNGGFGIGGAFEVFSAVTGNPPPQLTASNDTVVKNTANAGHGGNGGNGNGAAGGKGGTGEDAFGGGMDVRTAGMTSQLINNTIALNTVDSQTSNGSPGSGGSGGANGAQGLATGGGINSDGSAVLTNSVVALNQLVNGDQTNSGPDVGGWTIHATPTAGGIGTSTTFSYFGNPEGSNLLGAPLFNTATQTPMGNNYYGGFKDGLGTSVPLGASVGLSASLASTLPTPTLPLSSGSFLIGQGSSGQAASAVDQIGVSRANSQDLGAAELNSTSSTVSISGTLSGSPLNFSASSQSVTVSASVQLNGTAVTGGPVIFSLLEPNGTVLPGSTTSAAQVNNQGSTGNVTLTVPGGTVPGTYTLQATYTDANNKQYPPQTISSATLTVNALPASVSFAGQASATSQGVTATVNVTSNGQPVPGGSVQLVLTNANGVQVGSQSFNVTNGTTGAVTLSSNLPPGSYTLTASYTDQGGGYQQSGSNPSQTVTVQGPSPQPVVPIQPVVVTPPPPPLQVPGLLAFFDAILGGVETINADGTTTITDKIFGIPLLVATFNTSTGGLTSVSLFGVINVTFLFSH